MSMSIYWPNRLNMVTMHSVLREFLPMFARFGLPDVLVTENGPQLASVEFAVFVDILATLRAKQW